MLQPTFTITCHGASNVPLHSACTIGSVCRGLPQMSGFAAIAVDPPSWAEEALLALLRMQLPSSSNPGSGFCVLSHLNASSTVALEVAFQLTVLFW